MIEVIKGNILACTEKWLTALKANIQIKISTLHDFQIFPCEAPGPNQASHDRRVIMSTQRMNLFEAKTSITTEEIIKQLRNAFDNKTIENYNYHTQFKNILRGIFLEIDSKEVLNVMYKNFHDLYPCKDVTDNFNLSGLLADLYAWVPEYYEICSGYLGDTESENSYNIREFNIIKSYMKSGKFIVYTNHTWFEKKIGEVIEYYNDYKPRPTSLTEEFIEVFKDMFSFTGKVYRGIPSKDLCEEHDEEIENNATDYVSFSKYIKVAKDFANDGIVLEKYVEKEFDMSELLWYCASANSCYKYLAETYKYEGEVLSVPHSSRRLTTEELDNPLYGIDKREVKERSKIFKLHSKHSNDNLVYHNTDLVSLLEKYAGKFVSFQVDTNINTNGKHNEAYKWIRKEVGFSPIWCMKLTREILDNITNWSNWFPTDRKYLMIYEQEPEDVLTGFYNWCDVMYLLNDSTEEEYENEKYKINLEYIKENDGLHSQLLKRNNNPLFVWERV